MIKCRNKYLIILITILICMVALLSYKFGINYVLAEMPNSTNVLTDLQQDSNFKVSDYPDKADDYSIQVIQIAESTAKEFLIYTYQPCQRTTYLVATNVNMSLTESVDNTKMYYLELLSREGVFAKYKVKDIVVDTSKDCRYYNITSIYRVWNSDIDEGSGNDNTVNGVAYSVGRLYKASTIDGKVSYSYDKTETIEIINPYTGYLQYSNGFQFYESSCRSHYIAFDTDKPIDQLMEADVFFKEQKVIHKTGGINTNEYEKGELVDKLLPINYKQAGETPANGIFAKKYEWDRIQTSDYFINDPQNDLKDNVKQEILKTKWVVRFYETDYLYKPSMSGGLIPGISTEEYTDITNVSILRLKFRTGIKIYNLGTVSNIITGIDVPGNNNTDELDNPIAWLLRKLAEATGIPEWVWILIFVVIILAILLPVLSLIFPVVGQVLKVVIKALGKAIEWLFKALVWIITLPIKGIMWLIKKIKGGGSA